MKLPSVGAYLDESWRLYKDHFGAYARITIWYAITAGIALIAGFFVPTYGNLPFVDNLSSLYTPAAITAIIISMVNLVVILPIITLWITVGLIKYMHGVSSDRKMSTSEVMSDAGRVLLPAIGIAILLTLLFVAAFLVPWIPGMIFIILGMEQGGVLGVIGIILLVIGILTGLALLAYFSIRYSFALYEVIIGNATVGSSLSRSFDMTAKKFWHIALRWLVSGLIMVALGVTVNLATYFPSAAFVNLFLSNLQVFERVAVSLDLVLSLIVFMLLTPLSTSFGYVLYRHVSRR